MKRLSLVLCALLLVVGYAYAQGTKITIVLTETGYKGLLYASAQANAACKVADANAACDESPEAYAQRILSAPPEDWYRQLVAVDHTALETKLKALRESKDEAAIDAVFQAAGVAREETKPK